MLPLEVKRSWAFLVKILLMCGTLHNYACQSLASNDLTEHGDTCKLKNLLVVSVIEPQCAFPLGFNGSKVCFGVHGNTSHAACCQTESFNCNITITSIGNFYSFTLNKDILSNQDIVVMTQPFNNNQCMPSMFYNESDFPLNIDKCFKMGVKNFILSQDCLCWNTSTHDGNVCTGLTQNYFNLTIDPNDNRTWVLCKPPGTNSTDSSTKSSASPETTTKVISSTSTSASLHVGTSANPENAATNVGISVDISTNGDMKLLVNNAVGTGSKPENAAEVMRNLSSFAKMMGDATTATITIGNIKGVMTKLQKNPTNISVGIATNGDMKLLGDNDVGTGLSYLVHIPAEASGMAVNKNGSIAGLLLFPGMKQDDPKSFFFNNEIMGIEMGAQINHLSHTINIEYINVKKNGNNASCRSWNSTGNPIWVTDGCETVETNGSITCQCSHLTFFALLMSTPATNISASDYKSLTYITSIGCGLSMFFLAVGLYMHCLIRKGKSSQATKILMNLFVAMFILNLSFLVNESIANLGNYGACVVMAAVMHYTMLATFSWFFIEALHMYFNLRRSPNEIKHYMMKICISGWATPGIVVITLLALNKYGYLAVSTDDGNSFKMCWISDTYIQQGVNISYYAIVFIFTLSIFITTVQLMVLFKPAAGNAQDNISVKTKTFSILSLFLLLGITWAFAFFSYGPLLLASYYIFTILNSFQGFFLFIYYYNTSKTAEDGKNSTDSSLTLRTVVSSHK